MKCTSSKQKTESIDRIVFGCPILTSMEYKVMHDEIGQYIHWKIYKYYEIVDGKHKPKPIRET